VNRPGVTCGRVVIASSMLLAIMAWHATAIAAQLTLSWTAGSTDELGFSIERGAGTAETFGEIITTGPGITSYIDADLADATTYCYRVRAFNGGGYSDYSNTACGTTPSVFGLAVLRMGTGSGVVTSSPGGIACGPSCSASYPSGTSVTLSAAPASGSTFTGWSGGGCSGTATCTVAVTAVTTVTASFALESFALTASKTGTGNGTVTSAPAGIACGLTCSSNFSIGTSVSLSANPDAGSSFAGWSGACSGASSCTVTVTAAVSVTATFALQPVALTVSKAGGGSGVVTSIPTGIACGPTCSALLPSGTAVTLSAIPDPGSSFTGWSGGGCTGTGACAIALTAATTVAATFDLQPIALTTFRAGTGGGTITSVPSGIACGAICSWTYPSGSVLTLTATADAGSSFTGWSGACSGTGACTITLTAATTVTGTFALSTPTSFTDDFQRPDSTLLGNGWTELQGDFFIQSGMLWNGTQRVRHLAAQGSLTMSAGRLTAEFTSRNNSVGPAFGVIFSYRDPLNYYAAYRQAGGTSVLRIVRVVKGIETVIASKGCANAQRGVSFQLAVSFAADQVVLTVGNWNVAASGLAISPGAVGLMVNGGGWSHTIDNFAATP